MNDHRDFDVNGERFEPFRDQLQETFDRAISYMMKKGMNSVSITSKMDVVLIPQMETDPLTGLQEQVMTPIIQTEAKFDAKFSGKSDALKIGSGDEKIVWNKSTQHWSTRRIKSDQQSFDDGYGYDSEEENDG